jgi:hypothetical protein
LDLLKGKNTSEAIALFIAYDSDNREAIFINKLTNFMDSNHNDSICIRETKLKNNETYFKNIHYDLNENLIFWTTIDENNTTLFMAELDFKNYVKTSAKLSNMKKLLEIPGNNKFSYDWIHKLMFRSHEKSIYVSKIERMNISYKLYESDNVITRLLVNPLNSLIFWSENNGTDYIFRSNQDMTDIKKIEIKDLIYVQSIKIDYELERIFWFDRFVKNISSIDFDGNNFIVDYHFENDSFSDWRANFDLLDGVIYVYMKDKFSNEKILRINGRDHKLIQPILKLIKKIDIIAGVRIVHESRQPNSINSCLNSECTDLCLPKNMTHYRCICSKDHENETCIEKVSVFIYYF